MTIPIEEIRAAAAINDTYSGTLNGQLAEFYRTGGGDPGDVLLGLESEWLLLMGYVDVALDDKWHGYLTSFGFTGALLAALQAEADARHLFPQAGNPIIFAILLEDGDFLLTEDGFHLLNN